MTRDEIKIELIETIQYFKYGESRQDMAIFNEIK